MEKRQFLTAAALAGGILPTLEYDGKVHVLRGPLLLDVLAAAGAGVAGRPPDACCRLNVTRVRYQA